MPSREIIDWRLVFAPLRGCHRQDGTATHPMIQVRYLYKSSMGASCLSPPPFESIESIDGAACMYPSLWPC